MTPEYRPSSPVLLRQRLKNAVIRGIARLRRMFPSSSFPRITACQVCQSSETDWGWSCPACDRPICASCLNEFMAVGKIPECFNPLCEDDITTEEQPALTPNFRAAGKVFSLTQVIEMIQRGTPLTTPLLLSPSYLPSVLYYGFWGILPLTTSEVKENLDQLDILVDLENITSVLGKLSAKGLIRYKQERWHFPSRGFPFIYRKPHPPPDALGAAKATLESIEGKSFVPFVPNSQGFKKKSKISILGLNNAGKTTMLQRLKTGRWIPDTTPTIGMNAENIQIGGLRFSAWDLGGQLQFRRALWEMYTRNSTALIYIIDISDPKRLPEARNSLWRMLRMNHLKNIPVVIFANKIDVFEKGQFMTKEDLATSLGFNNKMNRVVNIFHTSAKSGVGIHDGLRWLVDNTFKGEQDLSVTLTEIPRLQSVTEPPYSDFDVSE